MAGRPPLGPARLSERLVVHVTAAEASRIEAAAAAAGVHRAEWIRLVLRDCLGRGAAPFGARSGEE